MEKKTKKIIKKNHNVICDLLGQLNLTILFILTFIIITNYHSYSQNIFYNTNDTVNNKINNIKYLKNVDSHYIEMIDLPPFNEQKKIIENTENNKDLIIPEDAEIPRLFSSNEENEKKPKPILGEISKNDEKWQKGGIYEGFTPEQEIIERRTKVAKHFQLSNGEYAAFIGSIKHYKDDNGAWQDIDLTIKNNNTNKHNEYKYCNTTNNVKTYFPEASDSLGIIVEYEDL